jgi:hypothetical protein
MKKIRNIDQLRVEQARLRERQLHLEKQMLESCRKVRKSISLKNFARDLAFEWMLNKVASRGVGRLLNIFRK